LICTPLLIARGLQPVAGYFAGYFVGKKKRLTKINQFILKTCGVLIGAVKEKIAHEQYRK
jgi:hypothetical protein